MSRLWTDEEKDYLYENVGKVKVDTIAQKLKRPIKGVTIKMKRLNIANTKAQTGLLTLGELASYLQVERKTVYHWAEFHNLPYMKKKTRTTREFKFIDTENFWEWAFLNQERIDFSKIEPHSMPPEPEWVNHMRNQKNEVKGNYYRPWTVKEEKRLLTYKEEGLSYKSISELMNRTAVSLARKHKRLLEQKNKRY